MAKPECTGENLLSASKARDFERTAQAHDRWLRQEPGKGDHRIEIYRLENGGELRNPWDGSHGEVSIGVRHAFVRRMRGFGLLLLVIACAVAYIIR